MKKSMKRSLRTFLVAALAVLLCAFLAACGGGKDAADLETISAEEATQEQTTQEETTKAAASSTLGQKTEKAMSFLLTNKTGKDIVSFVVRSSQEKSKDNLLENNDVFKKNETRMVFFEFPKDQPMAETEEAENIEDAENVENVENAEGAGEELASDEKDLPAECVIDLELADGTKFTLHSFPEDITKGEVYLEGGIGYLVYKHEGSGDSISTLMAEKAIKDSQPETEEETEEETTEEEEQEQEQVYEEPVYQEPVDEAYQEPVEENPVYEEPAPVEEGGYEEPAPVDEGGNEGGEGGYEEPAPVDEGGNGAGDDDGCVDDGLFY